MTPFISVIIPTFNSAKFLVQAIQSVFNQTYQNFEVIVVDDGSTDNTRKELKLFGQKIIYYYQENQGSSVARNKGIQLAKGDYLAFLDADDLWSPYKLESQIKAFTANSSSSLVCFGIDERVAENFDLSKVTQEIAETIQMQPSLSGYKLWDVITSSPYHINNMMVCRSLVKKFNINFNIKLRKGQDSNFIHKVCARTKVIYLDIVLSYYRTNANSITHRYDPIDYRRLVLDEVITNYYELLNKEYSVERKDIKKLYISSDIAHAYHHYYHAKYMKCFILSLKVLTRNIFFLEPYKLIVKSFLRTLQSIKLDNNERIKWK